VRQSLFATHFSIIVDMEIDQQLEQRINIKFLVKLGKSGPEICQMLQQAYGEDDLKRITVLKWVQRCREGRKPPRATKGQGALPLREAMKTWIECVLSCSVTAG
jgi:transposase